MAAVEAVEFATLDWVDWFNNRRHLEPLGWVPPVEYEKAFYLGQAAVDEAAAVLRPAERRQGQVWIVFVV